MSEPKSYIDWAMEALNYTPAWVSIGALTEEIGRNQFKLFNEPDADRSTEHYRYGAFRTYERNLQSLSDQDLQIWIDIGLNDDDLGMGSAIIFDLASLSFLSDGQFETIAKVFETVPFQNHISRRRVFREIEANPCEAAFWKAAQRSDLIGAHDRLLSRFGDQLSIELLEYMQENGRNKAVRNMARVQLKKVSKIGKRDN